MDEVDASALKLATTRLVESYQIESNDNNFIKTRCDIYNKAMLYRGKLAPFSKVVVKNIGKDCDTIIIIGKDYFDEKNLEEKCFKDTLANLTTKIESNKNLCVYTDHFHQKFLTEFKVIESQIIKSIKTLDLESEFKEKISKFTKMIEFKEIFEKYTKSNKTKQLIHYEKTVTIFEPLLESIMGYRKFLTTLAEKISVLRSELESLNERMSDDEPFVFIRRNAESVKEFCNKYHEMTPDIESDLKSIVEGNLDELNNNYIDSWVPDKIKIISEEEDLEKFEDLLKKMETSKFSDLRLIKKIYK